MKKIKSLVLLFAIVFSITTLVYGANDEENVDDQLSVDSGEIVNPSDPNSSQDLLLSTAREFEKNKEYSKAIENYKKYLQIDEYKNPDIIFALGDLYFKITLYEYALVTFKRDKSGHWKNNFGIATASRFLGNYKNAIIYYRKVLAAKPNFVEAYLGLGISYQLNSEFDEAIVNLKKYLSYTKKEEVYIGLANICMKTGKYQEAKDIVEEGLAAFGNSQILKDLSEEAYKK